MERDEGLWMVRRMEGVWMEVGVGRVKEKDGRRRVKGERSTDGRWSREGMEWKKAKKERV